MANDGSTDASDEESSIPPGARAERRGLRLSLLAALAVAAAGALFGQPRVVLEVREGALGPNALWIAPAAFAVVVALAAVDAWRSARRSGFFPGRSVLLVAGSAVFIGVLVPEAWSEYRTRTSPPSTSAAHYAALAQHKDARVRALVMEAAGLRPGDDREVAPLLERGLSDPDPLVVEAARVAVGRRAGGVALDLAGARAAVSRWQ